eukprot:COSAG06_NODE_2834_length_6204_cov_12.577396_9_plen_171_part_00
MARPRAHKARQAFEWLGGGDHGDGWLVHVVVVVVVDVVAMSRVVASAAVLATIQSDGVSQWQERCVVVAGGAVWCRRSRPQRDVAREEEKVRVNMGSLEREWTARPRAQVLVKRQLSPPVMVVALRIRPVLFLVGERARGTALCIRHRSFAAGQGFAAPSQVRAIRRAPP